MKDCTDKLCHYIGHTCQLSQLVWELISRFEVAKKANPDIPIGIAEILQNPDFLKTSPVLRQLIRISNPNLKLHTSYSQQPIRNRDKQSPLSLIILVL
jgi:hypothetical protein